MTAILLPRAIGDGGGVDDPNIRSLVAGIPIAPLRAMRKELTKLFEMIEELDTAMMTTRRRDGHLVSRAMANQKHAPGADLWFVTSESSAKLDELGSDPHVNLAYYKDRTREWISVAGLAKLSRDRATIRELYAPDWKMWFPDEGDPRHGTPDDPRLVLIGVDVHSAVFLEVNKPQPVVLYEIAKGWITGTEPDIGEMHRVEKEAGVAPRH
jgi:general stress protein 26